MKRLFLILAILLVLEGCWANTPGGASNPTPATPTANAALPEGITALPLEANLDYCLGDAANRAAVVRIPEGPRYWEVIPGQLDSLELMAVDEPIIAVVYPEGWAGRTSGAVGAPRQTRRPGTWDVCVEVESGAYALAGAPFVVYTNVDPTGALVAP